jgi:branched-chain amino acid transport system permease protein
MNKASVSSMKALFHYAPLIVIAAFLGLAPLCIGTALVSLLTKVVIFSLLAMSLDIIFGYTGLWSFAHAAIFGVAAYTNAIMIKHFGITNFWLTAPSGIFMAGITSAIFGLIALRVSGIYFLLITFALGQLVFSVAVEWVNMTGGSDGIGGIPYPDIGFSFSAATYYYFALVISIICAFLLRKFIKSPFGQSLQGIRESEIRMRSLGYNTWLHKFMAFIVSGLFGGVAGILYTHFNGLITPASIGMAASGLVIIMIIIGGTGTLWGGVVGSAFISVLGYFVSIASPERWPVILGACFVASVMFARKGIFPLLVNAWRSLSKHESA